MPRPWRSVAAEDTADGRLELLQRGEREFLIQIAGRVLMNSTARRSEEQLAVRGCARITAANPRVLIGGLGMAYTLRAALDVIGPGASLTVAELNPVIVAWCRGPLAALTDNALLDPRMTLHMGDVAKLISSSPRASFDAILLDLYQGPHAATQRPDDPFYSAGALRRQRAALAPGGVLAVWGEDRDPAYEERFTAAGFTLEPQSRERGGASWRHAVYVGVA